MHRKPESRLPRHLSVPYQPLFQSLHQWLDCTLEIWRRNLSIFLQYNQNFGKAPSLERTAQSCTAAYQPSFCTREKSALLIFNFIKPNVNKKRIAPRPPSWKCTSILFGRSIFCLWKTGSSNLVSMVRTAAKCKMAESKSILNVKEIVNFV